MICVTNRTARALATGVLESWGKKGQSNRAESIDVHVAGNMKLAPVIMVNKGRTIELGGAAKRGVAG